jgi:hypothetical protein
MPVRLFGALLALLLAEDATAAGVVVLANRAGRDVTGTVSVADGPPRRVTVPQGDLTFLAVASGATFSYVSANHVQTARIEENSAYVLSPDGDDLRLVTLYAGSATAAGAKNGNAEGAVESPPAATLAVKLLVDGQEPDKSWETRLRKRLGAASEILERQCGVKLEIVSIGTWDSSAAARGFEEQFADFTRKVSARPANLAIGFSSRRPPTGPSGAQKPLTALAVPLQAHILIGEWFALSEPQRLEVLLHELGHCLGAVHSKSAESVMRLNPSDGRSVDKKFRIGYDPVNALTMNLVAREAFQTPPIRKPGGLSRATRLQLARIYKEQARLFPEDTAPEKYLQLLDEAPLQQPTRSADPLVSGARSVVAAITAAADAAAELRLSDDRLTEHCLRAAAAAAGKLPEAQRVPGFLLGLAVGLDSSDTIRKAAPTRSLWTRVEGEDERLERLKLIGQPTLRGKHDRTRHFVVAAALTAVAGSKAADADGIVHELFAAENGGRFSLAELAIEYAGAAFARALAREPARLAKVAGAFSVDDYIPATDGFEETYGHEDFVRQFGSFRDARFLEREREVRRLVQELPAYKSK